MSLRLQRRKNIAAKRSLPKLDSKTIVMSTVCKNCGINFKGNYCFNCSQKAGTARLRFSNIISEFWHNFTHTDKSIFGLFSSMVVNPGLVIREYISGKRKKYFSPFAFFLIITAALIFVTGKVFKYEDSLFQVRNEFGQYLSKNYNIIIMLSLPFLAIILKLVFFKLRYNFAEWCTFLVFTFGFINAIQLIIHSFYFLFIEYHYKWEVYVKLFGYLIFIYVLISFIKPRNIIRWIQCILSGMLAYFFFEIIGSGAALWWWGMPLDQVIQNSF
jgi:hypothetical protein